MKIETRILLQAATKTDHVSVFAKGKTVKLCNEAKHCHFLFKIRGSQNYQGDKMTQENVIFDERY